MYKNDFEYSALMVKAQRLENEARRARRKAHRELEKALQLGNESIDAAEAADWTMTQATIDLRVNQIVDVLEAFRP